MVTVWSSPTVVFDPSAIGVTDPVHYFRARAWAWNSDQLISDAFVTQADYVAASADPANTLVTQTWLITGELRTGNYGPTQMVAEVQVPLADANIGAPIIFNRAGSVATIGGVALGESSTGGLKISYVYGDIDFGLIAVSPTEPITLTEGPPLFDGLTDVTSVQTETDGTNLVVACAHTVTDGSTDIDLVTFTSTATPVTGATT